ncbi:MAG TPA: DUF222 domain-containing protein [Acidimicrobiales bacterium]|nr:DUF222 domain-containing protein [Acidimicrobiales bacterium]
MFDALATGVKEVTNLDLGSLGDEELSEAVVELASLRSALEAGEARVDKVWNDRRAWAADGAKAGSAWLARRTGEDKSDCGSRLWLGRVVEDMPLVKEAWLAGQISAAHVRRLAKARNRRTEEAFGESEAMLVNHAITMRFRQFTTALDYWVLHADPDGADETEMERLERRRACCDETLNGMFSGSFLLDAIGGTILSNELRRLEAKLFEADWAEAKQRLGRDPLIFELARTPGQRRADALVEMGERSAGNVENKKAKPLFTLLLGSETFSRLSELEDGLVVSPGAIRRWISDAELERILFDGETGRYIDVSRKRSFTGALRRLIQVRDRSCYHQYCDEPASRCQVDHIQPWSEGGMTDQYNGRLACGCHNRLRQKRPPPPPPDEAGG